MGGLFSRLQDEIDSREQGKGLSPTDLLDLPTELVEIIRKILRRNGMELASIAAEVGRPETEVQPLLDDLVTKGFLRRVEVRQTFWYKAYIGRKAEKRISDVWATLGKTLDEEGEDSQPGETT